MHFTSFLLLAGLAAAAPTHKRPTTVQAVHPRMSPTTSAGSNTYRCRVLPNLNILSCLGLDNNLSGFNLSLPVNVGGIADGSVDGSANGIAEGAAAGAGTGLGTGLGSDLGGILNGITDGDGAGGILKKKKN